MRDADELTDRLAERNRRGDAATVPISASTLALITEQSESPEPDEGAERPEDALKSSSDH